jgi:Domain of unknown function (DUF397)
MSEGNYTCWRKSSYSNSSGNCVEVTSAERLVAVRDTKQGGRGSRLEFTEATWRRFVATTKSGKLVR